MEGWGRRGIHNEFGVFGDAREVGIYKWVEEGGVIFNKLEILGIVMELQLWVQCVRGGIFLMNFGY